MSLSLPKSTPATGLESPRSPLCIYEILPCITKHKILTQKSEKNPSKAFIWHQKFSWLTIMNNRHRVLTITHGGTSTTRMTKIYFGGIHQLRGSSNIFTYINKVQIKEPLKICSHSSKAARVCSPNLCTRRWWIQFKWSLFFYFFWTQFVASFSF